MERKICIIFVGNKEKLKIMSKSIVEMNQYFKERPELWAKLTGVMGDGCEPKIEQSLDSVGAWAKSLASEGVLECARSIISLSIMDAFSKLEVRGEIERGAREEFKMWYLGEWQEEHVVCYKGFNNDLTCLAFQYEVGKEYEIKVPIAMCERGFHACKNPLDVFDFYSGKDKRYCVVEQWGYMEEAGRKTVSSNIKVVKEISLKELFEIAVEKMEWNKSGMFSEEGDEEERQDGVEMDMDTGAEKIILTPSLYNGNIREIKGFDLWHETFVGAHGDVILRESFPNVSNITGNENLIGSIKSGKRINVLGGYNGIYVLESNNNVNITGNGNKVYVTGVDDTQINVQGCDNYISVKGKADVVCVGYRNTVRAGIGSTITFAQASESVSVFIDGEEYTDKDTIYFNKGVVEKDTSREEILL